MIWEQNDHFDEKHTIVPMQRIQGVLLYD